MAWSFNVFTGNLDQTGSSGAVVFEGEVETFADLPETQGDPAVGASYLVRSSTGVWLVNRRQAGIWIRKNNTGVRATDWEYGGDYPVNSVNGQTGNVSLTNTDVGAAPATGISPSAITGTAVVDNDARLSDSRTPTAHAASHAAGTKAQFSGQVAGMTENVLIRANTAGTAGNSITLSFDGVDDIDTVLGAWNSANPSNQATLISGYGSQVPDNGEEIALSGGVAGGSDPFKNINQDLGTSDTPVFDGLVVAKGGTANTLAFGNHVANFVAEDGTSDAPLVLIGGTGNIEIFKDKALSKALSYGFSVPSQLATDDFIVSLYNGSWGEKFRVAQNGSATVKGNLVLTDNTGNETATFDANGNLTANRTYDLPNASGVLALTSDIPSTFAASAITSGTFDNARINFAAPPAIGSTTPSTGAFTTLTATPSSGSALTLTGGTITASAPLIDATQTWNSSGTTFTGVRFNITNTASATASIPFDFQIDGTSRFQIRRDGATSVENYYRFTGLNAGMWVHSVGGQEVAFGSSPNHWFTMTSTRLRLSGDISLGRSGSAGQAVDCILVRDDAGVLAQRNGTNAQTLRLYNTYTDANNHERGFLRWSSNVFQIGTEKGSGGGTARALEFQTDGLTRLTISAGGSVVHGLSNGVIGWTTSSILRPQSGNGTLCLFNNAQTDWNRLQFGGIDANFPALKRSSTALQVRLADDSAFAPLSCGALTLNGNLDASTRDIVTDTTTGTKIGTGTTQKIGFFNATPVVQQAAVADATDAASTQARLNDLLARLRTLGLIAT